MTHRWVGLVGYSRDERAFAGAVPGHDGLYVAGGYNGTGNLNGFTAGRIISELLATGASSDALSVRLGAAAENRLRIRSALPIWAFPAA